jgi:Bor protein
VAAARARTGTGDSVRLRALALAFLLAAPGCYRTVYLNLLPPNMPPAVETDQTMAKQRTGGWQSFFVWGLLPTEKTFDAAAMCGGEDHVSRIETEQTFVQGLIQSVAGYYINVYSPWNARIYCDHTRSR